MEKYTTTELSLFQLNIGALSNSTAHYISSTPYISINSNGILSWENSKQESSIEEDIKNNIRPRLDFTDLDTNEKLSIYDNLEIKPTLTIGKLKEEVNDAIIDGSYGCYIKQYPITLGHSEQTIASLRDQRERINMMHKY